MRNPGEDADVRRTARNYALRLLEMQDRTAKELERKLRAKGFPAELAMDIVADMRACGYVDDEKLAARYVASGAETRGIGPLRIRADLERRGIAREIVEEALLGVYGGDREDEVALGVARAWAGKHLPAGGGTQAGAGGDIGARRRLHGFLARRGFSPEAIGRALGRVLERS